MTIPMSNAARALPALLALTFPITAEAQNLPTTVELEGLLEEWRPVFERVQLPGMSFVVVRDGEVIHLGTYGVRDDAGNPVTPDTGFYIASITKTYVAMAIQILAQEGRIDLDQPVRKYLPRFTLADADATKTITVRDLLCHAPGLNSGPAVFLDAYTGEITEDRYYHFLSKTQPRGQTSYTNTHFTLAGRIIEAVTGEKWQDYLVSKIFEPAKMSRTTAYASKLYGDMDTAFPMLPSSDGPKLSPQRKNDSTMHAAGGLGTSARDMATWLLLNLGLGTLDDERTILKVEFAMEMQTQQSHLTQSRKSGSDISLDGFGLGWMMGEFRGERILAHGGGYTGASSYMIFLPDHDLGVGYLANTSGAGGAAAMEMLAEILDRLIPLDSKDRLVTAKRNSRQLDTRPASTSRARQPLGAAQLSLAIDEYAGHYKNEHWGTVALRLDSGQLQGNIGAVSLSFLPSSQGKDHCRVASSATNTPDQGQFITVEGEVRALKMAVFGILVEFTRDR